MTRRRLLNNAQALLRECTRCADTGEQITIDGNSYNACEAWGGINFLTQMIRVYCEEQEKEN